MTTLQRISTGTASLINLIVYVNIGVRWRDGSAQVASFEIIKSLCMFSIG